LVKSGRAGTSVDKGGRHPEGGKLIGLLAMQDTEFAQRSADAEKTRAELQSVRRQCESVKMLLAENTTEKDIMYEVRVIILQSCFADVYALIGVQ